VNHFSEEFEIDRWRLYALFHKAVLDLDQAAGNGASPIGHGVSVTGQLRPERILAGTAKGNRQIGGKPQR
jgi:hypothetical protein